MSLYFDILALLNSFNRTDFLFPSTFSLWNIIIQLFLEASKEEACSCLDLHEVMFLPSNFSEKKAHFSTWWINLQIKETPQPSALDHEDIGFSVTLFEPQASVLRCFKLSLHVNPPNSWGEFNQENNIGMGTYKSACNLPLISPKKEGIFSLYEITGCHGMEGP